jgi:hypothetical protein
MHRKLGRASSIRPSRKRRRCRKSDNPTQISHFHLYGISRTRNGLLTLPEHALHTHRPQSRQWCLLLLHPNSLPHLIHSFVLPSGIHTGGTQCSTFRLRSVGCFFSFSLPRFVGEVGGLKLLLPFKVAKRSSDGWKGSACNERRIWFVDDDEVSVELGLVAFKLSRSSDLACRIAVTHSSRLCSDARREKKRNQSTYVTFRKEPTTERMNPPA